MGTNTEQDYINHVTRLGDNHTVQTSEDIYSHSGVKLVNKGVQINKGFYDDLVKHKLLKPIDFSLNVEDCVTTTDLYKEARKLIEEVPWLNMLVKSMHDQDLPLRILSAIDLAPPLAFKLTVARERSPQVFEHCIEVALISICLGEHAGLDRQALKDIAAAGVFHDLGILHINHELLDPERKLTEEDKQSLFAHPLISYLILKEFPQYHPSVSKAVLDHHERMNGSGYPRGIKNDEISEFGEILAIAELVISFINKNPGVQMQDKLNIILKFNRHNYSEKFTHYLINIFKSIPSVEIEKNYSSFDMANILTAVQTVRNILHKWAELSCEDSKEASNDDYRELVALIDERIQELKYSLADVGISLEDFSAMIPIIKDDPASIDETAMIVDEMVFQIKMLFGEIGRHLHASKNSILLPVLFTNWLESSKQKINN